MSEDKYPYISGGALAVPAYDASEQDVVLQVFSAMLRSATRDGGAKRAAGLKPPWYKDNSHEAAVFSHLNKWKHGEAFDADSGVHPLVHLAWRALAIAYQETVGKMDPAQGADWRYALRPFGVGDPL